MVTDTHFLNYNIFTKGLPPDEHRHDDTISLIFLACNSVIQETAGTQYLSSNKPEMEAKLTLNGLCLNMHLLNRTCQLNGHSDMITPVTVIIQWRTQALLSIAN